MCALSTGEQIMHTFAVLEKPSFVDGFLKGELPMAKTQSESPSSIAWINTVVE